MQLWIISNPRTASKEVDFSFFYSLTICWSYSTLFCIIMLFLRLYSHLIKFLGLLFVFAFFMIIITIFMIIINIFVITMIIIITITITIIIIISIIIIVVYNIFLITPRCLLNFSDTRRIYFSVFRSICLCIRYRYI